MIRARNRLRTDLVLSTMLLLANPAYAEGKFIDSFQVHGFASQSFILTSNNNFFGDSKDHGSFDFRELGLNASWRVSPKFLVAAQGVARWAGRNDEGAPRLDYGLVDYTLLSNVERTWGVRLGRVVNPIGFYNDTRDVAFTRPSIFLPQSVYFARVRDLTLSADGGQLYSDQRTSIGDFSFQFNIVRPRVGSREELALLNRDFPGELEGDFSFGGRLLYEKDGGAIRLAVSSFQADFSFEPERVPNHPSPQAGSIKFVPVIFSGQYNREQLTLTSEVALRYFKYTDFGPIIPEMSFTGLSWYIQASYRLTPRWGVVARFDRLCIELGDCNGDKFAARTGQSAHRRFADDWMVGARWDVTSSIMLRAEFHHIRGTGWITVEDNPNLNNLKENWNMFAFLVSFRF